MHYHLEVILPPTPNLESALKQILSPFDKNSHKSPTHAFWDWYQIGGRYTGAKLLAALEKPQLEAFYQALNDEGITVSTFTAGKQTLSPPEQAEKVNSLWLEYFPESPIKSCPIFDNYKDETGNILPLKDTPKSLTSLHIIIAGPDYSSKTLTALYMAQTKIWNGVMYQSTTWDGTLSAALNDFNEYLETCNEEWAKSRRPKDDWIVITVDYHN